MLLLKDSENSKALLYAGCITAAVGAGYLFHRKLTTPRARKGPYTPDTLPADAYDAIIVGAGEFLS